MHRGLVLDAEARRVSLNEVVKRAFAEYLERFALRAEDAGGTRIQRACGKSLIFTSSPRGIPAPISLREAAKIA
jgi:hypothetical protein